MTLCRCSSCSCCCSYGWWLTKWNNLRPGYISKFWRYVTRITVVILWCLTLWSLLGDLFLPKSLLKDSSTTLCLSEPSEGQQNAVIDSLFANGIYDPQEESGENLSTIATGFENSSFILVYNSSSLYYCFVTVFRSNDCPSLIGVKVYLLDNASLEYYNSSDHIANITSELDLQAVISHEVESQSELDSLADIPEGHFFALTVLVIVAAVFGFVARILHLPPLIGMLLAGFLLRNVPYINIAGDISNLWSSALRNVALVVILTRGGISLDSRQLRRLKLAVPLLAFTPCIIEGAVDGVVAIFYLKMPWAWGLMLGYILAAVSPAVVVPSVLALQEKGYGVRKGITTLILAAASMDDVIAISLFGVFLGLAFSEGSLILDVFRAPIELVLGITYGTVFGLLLWAIPTKHHSESSRSRNRFFLLLGLTLLSAFGSRRAVIGGASLAGAGALGVLVTAFVAAQGWESLQLKVIARVYSLIWQLAQPILFGLIGAAVDLSVISGALVGQGVLLILIGLTVRIVIALIVTLGNGFCIKEMAFIAMAWLPKATVQAAVGSIALDLAIERNAGEAEINLGIQVLTIAVLSILLTAPVGALCISILGPFLLTKDTAEDLDHMENEGSNNSPKEPKKIIPEGNTDGGPSASTFEICFVKESEV